MTGRFGSVPCVSHPPPRTNGLAWEYPPRGNGRRQEQTGLTMKHVHASSCIMFINIPLAKSSHMVTQSQSGRALQSHLTWISGEVKNRCHFHKLPKKTALKMTTKAGLSLISWHLGNRTKWDLFVQCTILFHFSLSGFYLEGGCQVRKIQLPKEKKEERRL